MYIVFDTETTGKALNFNARYTDVRNWPRMVQLAWQEYDENGKLLRQFDLIVKPDGYVIPDEAIAIHRISNEKAHEKGIALDKVLDAFNEAIDRNKVLIAHNIKFDNNVIACEMHRLNKAVKIFDCQHVDTMISTINFCAIPNKKGDRFKFPQLSELYHKLFNSYFEGAHDALVDVEALAKCFFELKRIGVLGNFVNSEESAKSILDGLFSKVKNDGVEGEERPFVNLCNHSYHSILEGACSIKEYVSLAKKHNHPAIAITDVSTLSGTFELFQKSGDIKAVYGIEFYVNDKILKIQDTKLQGDVYKLRMYAKSKKGFQNLSKLLYLANTQGYNEVGRICPEWIQENSGDIIVTTTSLEGKIAKYLLLGQVSKAETYFEWLLGAFGKDNVYIEFQLSAESHQKIYNTFMVKMAQKYGVKSILTNNTYFSQKEDWELQHLVYAMKQKLPLSIAKLKENSEWYFYGREDFYRANEQYGFNYPKQFIDRCLDRTLEIADRCNFEFETGVENFPKYEPEQKMIDWVGSDDVEVIIKKLSHAKLKQRLKKESQLGTIKLNDEVLKIYEDRLNYEINVIKEKGMLDYFMVCWEMVFDYEENEYEGRKHIVGPGRGCFLPDSKVKLYNNTYKSIQLISVGDKVYDSYGECRIVKNVLCYDVNEEVICLKFNNGKVIKCTLDHEILTTNNGWVQAQKLSKNDDVVDINNSCPAKLDSTETFNYCGKVYDLTIDKTHCYNIEGIGVHNSAAGCLLSWCLGIVKIDPVRHELYFERFINPERNSSPDIDLDFMTSTDHITDSFLLKKYGKERVLSVGTFTTFNEKSCLKDVSRTLLGKDSTSRGGIIYKIIDALPIDKAGKWLDAENKNLQEWFENYPNSEECDFEIKEFILRNEKVVKYTIKLLGEIKGVGQHAAGVVITPGPSWEYVPVNVIPKGKDEPPSIVTAFQESDGAGKDLSALGILKLDRLKLETINIIEDCIALIKQTKNIDIREDVYFLDLHDKNLFEEVRLGLNHGIFQFESAGMGKLIKSMNVENFEELVACNALYRPGPMGIGAHEEFVKNKLNPKQIKYIHPSLEPILSQTNGVMVYQEQLMFIAKQIGGITLGEGDLLRRYMGNSGDIIKKEIDNVPLSENEKENKNFKNFKKYWDMFLKGAKSQNYSDKEIDELKAYILKYLGYSFNKCLSENHHVITEHRGKIKLLDVNVGEKVLSYNSKTNKNEFNTVKEIHHNGIKKIFKVCTKSGNTLECTLDHKIMTNQGMKTLEEIIHSEYQIKTNNGFEKIVDFNHIGELQTYDLEIDNEEHNYYANNICVSNSHSLSYSYVACQTLYLKHYYPTEYYCSLLNHPKSSGTPEEMQEWISSAISSAMSKGIKVSYPTRKSSWNWRVTGENEITMGFSAIKGFGDVAYEELNSHLKSKGVSFETVSKFMFFDTSFSKFNKTAFERMLKAGVFDDWSHSRQELNDLYQNSVITKKKRKISNNQINLFGVSYESQLNPDTVKYKETSLMEKRQQFLESCNCDLFYLKKVTEIKQKIADKTQKYILSINDCNEKDYYYFILDKVEVGKTNTGKLYLILTVSDGVASNKLRVFGDDVKKIDPILEKGGVYIGKFQKNKKGFINFSKIIPKGQQESDNPKKEIYLIKFDNIYND